MSFYTLIYLDLARLITEFLEFLLVLFTFVGDKPNHERTVKKSKRGPKRMEQGVTRWAATHTADGLGLLTTSYFLYYL